MAGETERVNCWPTRAPPWRQIYIRLYGGRNKFRSGIRRALQVFVGHCRYFEHTHSYFVRHICLKRKNWEDFVRKTFCDFVNQVFSITFYTQYELLINIRYVCFLIVCILNCDVNNRRELVRMH
jgi:hypothetical protein